MKKILLTTVFGAALFAAAPVFAQTGYVGASAGHARADAAGDEGEAQAYSVFGRLNGDLDEATRLGLQIDAALTHTNAEDAEDNSFAGALHFYRKTEAGKFGIFGGLSNAEDGTTVNGGVEGKVDLQQATVGGALGYFDNNELDLNGWTVRGNVASTLANNLTPYGSVGFTNAEAFNVNIDGWDVTAGVEYPLANSPVSLFAEYTHGEVEDFDVTTDGITIGLTYTFGAGASANAVESASGIERSLRSMGLGGLSF